ADPVEEYPDQVSDFSSRCTTVCVKFIDHEMKQSGAVSFKPLTCEIKKWNFHAAHQHDVQHRVVRNEDVRRRILHIPARPHFSTIHTGKESRGWRPRDSHSLPFHLAKLLPQLCFFRCVLSSGNRRFAGIAAKIDLIPSALVMQPIAGSVAI